MFDQIFRDVVVTVTDCDDEWGALIHRVRFVDVRAGLDERLYGGHEPLARGVVQCGHAAHPGHFAFFLAPLLCGAGA